MVRQCPRCWEKVSPEDEICPNCGYDFAARRKAAQEPAPENASETPVRKKVIFPTPRDKSDGDRVGILYKLVFFLTLAWAVLAVSGGFYNLYVGNLLQGAGFLASGLLSAVSFFMILHRERRTLAGVIVLISGAASLNIALLVVSFAVSYLVMCCKPDFKDE